MDFTKFFVAIILLLASILGYLIAKYSQDELKGSNKVLLFLKLILHLLILTVVLLLMWPLNYLEMILIIIGLVISFIFSITYLIIIISIISINLNIPLSILLVCLIFLYFLINGILSFKTLKLNINPKIIFTLISISLILLLTLFNNKDLSIIYAFIFGYLINFKNLKTKPL